MRKTQLTIRLRPKVMADLKLIAQEEEVSLAGLIATIIDEGMERRTIPTYNQNGT